MRNALFILGFGLLSMIFYAVLTAIGYIFDRTNVNNNEDDILIQYVSKLIRGVLCLCIYIMVLHELGIFIQPFVAIIGGIIAVVFYILARDKANADSFFLQPQLLFVHMYYLYYT